MTTSVSRLRTVDLVRIALMAVLITVCAWISIPMAVPFTLQIFGVFTAVLVLGGRKGSLAVGLYLLMGAVGLPVFAGFQGGLGALLGTTGGYIAGFLVCAVLAGLVTALLGDGRLSAAVGCLAGLAACYAFGTVWFWVLYTRTTGPVGLMTVLGWCVFPYVIPDLTKMALAIFVSRRVRRFLAE